MTTELPQYQSAFTKLICEFTDLINRFKMTKDTEEDHFIF